MKRGRQNPEYGRLKAVLFDLDGVLVSTVELHQTAFIEAMRQTANIVITPEFHMDQLNALSTREKIHVVKAMGHSELDHLGERVWATKQQMTTDLIPQIVKPRVEHLSMMGQLRGLNYKIACVSNSIRKTTMEMLSAAGFLTSGQRNAYGYFDIIVSNEDVNRQKPAPDPYLQTAASLGLEPDQCLAIEDADRGLRSAISAGCHTLQVGSPDDVKFGVIWDMIRETEGWK